MTKGSLIIKKRGEGSCALYTHHTAMDIPDVVKEAPLIFINKHYYVKTKNDFLSFVKCNGSYSDWLYYPNCLAAAIIAVRPMFLYPVKRIEERTWHDYTLSIKRDEWHLKVDDQLTVISPFEIIHQSLPEKCDDLQEKCDYEEN